MHVYIRPAMHLYITHTFYFEIYTSPIEGIQLMSIAGYEAFVFVCFFASKTLCAALHMAAVGRPYSPVCLFIRLFLHVTCIYDYVILCHCTLAAALYFEQSSCDELMEFKQIQTRAQPEESLKHNHSCTNISPRTRPLLLHSGDRFVQLWLCFNDSSGCALV